MNAEPLLAAGILIGAVALAGSARRASAPGRRAGGGTIPGPGSAHSHEWSEHLRRVGRSGGPWHVVRRSRGGDLLVSGTHHDADAAVHEASMLRQSGRSAAILPGAAPLALSDDYLQRAKSVLATVPARHRSSGGSTSAETATIHLSERGARILQTLGPRPWDGGSRPEWHGSTATVDRASIGLLLIQSGPGVGFPAGDRKRITAAADRLGVPHR